MRETFSYIIKYIKQPVIAMFFYNNMISETAGTLKSFSCNCLPAPRMKSVNEVFRELTLRRKNRLKFRKNLRSNVSAFILGCLFTTFSLSAAAITDALKLKISSTAYSDEMVIRYLAGATAGFDGSYDARKLFSPNPAVPAIYTMIDPVTCLSINAYPALAKDEKVQLFARVGSTGTYTITATEPGMFGAGVDIFIENTETNYFQNLRTNPVFTFYVTDTGAFNSSKGKFNIYFSLPVIFSTVNNSFDDQSTCRVSKEGSISWTYVAKDNSNTVIASATVKDGVDTLFNLSPGKYYFTSYYGSEATKEQFFYTGGITGVNEPAPGENYKLFFENNNLTVDFDHVNQQYVALSVFTLDGLEIANAKLSDVSKLRVPYKEEVSGIYIVKLQADKTMVIKKISLAQMMSK